jgi:hypothetical protein
VKEEKHRAGNAKRGETLILRRDRGGDYGESKVERRVEETAESLMKSKTQSG